MKDLIKGAFFRGDRSFGGGSQAVGKLEIFLFDNEVLFFTICSTASA
jgi:hypothetical protein